MNLTNIGSSAAAIMISVVAMAMATVVVVGSSDVVPIMASSPLADANTEVNSAVPEVDVTTPGLRGSNELFEMSSEGAVALNEFSNDVQEIFSQISSTTATGAGGDDDSNSSGVADDRKTLSASVHAFSLIKDRMADPQLILSLPRYYQPMFKTIHQEIISVEKHMKKLDEYISKYGGGSDDGDGGGGDLDDETRSDIIIPSRRILKGSKKDTPTSKLHPKKYNRKLSKADYHSRTKNRQPYGDTNGLGHQSSLNHNDPHQQGYHGARTSRQESSGPSRRLQQQANSTSSSSVCVDPDQKERKTEQCLRLAACAINYSLYDMFVFFFSDDINFDSGEVDSTRSLTVFDESDLIGKLSRIKSLSQAILDSFSSGIINDPNILQVGNTCDELLQEYHRFDEGLGVNGKWQGGSVTGVCRGWGSNNFVTLESIYSIADSGLTVKQRVDNCIQNLVQDFNIWSRTSPTNFTIDTLPLRPCEVELMDPDNEGSFVDFSEDALDVDATVIMADIRRRFTCLYYSFLADAGMCSTGAQLTCCENTSECRTACGVQPVFPADGGVIELLGGFSDGQYFDHIVPVNLLPLEERINEMFSQIFENFSIDYSTPTELTAEKLIIAVFDEYMGCADSIVQNLGTRPGAGQIFANYTGSNPYAPNEFRQFALPLRINDGGTDMHGQIQATFLDGIYKYVSVGDIGEDQELVAGQDGTSTLSGNLKSYLARQYSLDESFDNNIAYYQGLDECDESCEDSINALVEMRETFFGGGLDRSSLDDSIALIFGNQTTIGQICSFAQGLKNEVVDNVPGFCCLDAPYESLDWGEIYSCKKYAELSDGSTRVVQKSESDCKRVGPITSGFNEAACDVFDGTWCLLPRDCSELVECINSEKQSVQESRSRQAFFTYLDDAPLVMDTSDVEKCGQLREYFDYDKEYPDDERICNEVLDLQCFTDFDNLDGLASGTPGAGSSGLADLAVSTQLVLHPVERFDLVGGRAWRNTNVAFMKALEIIKFVVDTVSRSKNLCMIAISAFPGTAAPCVVPLYTISIVFGIIAFIIQQVFALSERLYHEIVDRFNLAYDRERQDTIYQNVITNHGNIVATFSAAQQLKVLLGETSEGLAADREEEEEEATRRLQTDCESTKDGNLNIFTFNCTKRSCEDPSRVCDGTFYYPYVAALKGAGCDDLDSDGDGLIDVCEDRYPPELVVRDALLFRGDVNDTSRLVYNKEVFNSEKQVEHFLRYQFAPTDDCSPTTRLSVEVEKQEGTCRESVYEITPVQNIESCDGTVNVGVYNIGYTNPFLGNSRTATVAVDDEAPVVQCGFRPDSTSMNIVDGKTLYHYMSNSDRNGNRLVDSRLIYNVTDNCEDNIDINIVVNSNELEQNNIAELFSFRMRNSVQQAKFLYAPRTCENAVGRDHFCDESVSHVRYYVVDVTATDSAGNIGRDTCKVAIVSSCYHPEPDYCEKSQAGKYYYAKSHIDNAISEQPILYKVSTAKLAWEASLETIAYPEPPRVPSSKAWKQAKVSAYAEQTTTADVVSAKVKRIRKHAAGDKYTGEERV